MKPKGPKWSPKVQKKTAMSRQQKMNDFVPPKKGTGNTLPETNVAPENRPPQ